MHMSSVDHWGDQKMCNTTKKNELELWVQECIVHFIFQESANPYPEGDSTRPYCLLSDIVQVGKFVS
jgi:hypothetical protein